MAKSNCPVLAEVRLKHGESADRLIKRFVKKCKKGDIIKEYLDKVSFHRTKSQKRRAKRSKNRFLREKDSIKAQKSNNNSF